MKDYLTELASGLSPYTPGEQPKDKKYVKLNTNENPYAPSQNVKDAIYQAMEDLRLYPDPDATELRKTIAEYYNDKLLNHTTIEGQSGHLTIKEDQPGHLTINENQPGHLTEKNIFVGNGSDEVIAFIFPAFFQGRKIAFPNITYSFYPVYASLFQTETMEIPLEEDFTVNIKDYMQFKQGECQGILIPNPNAPTGHCLSLDEIEEILQANKDKVVVIDEAYIDFGGETAIGLVPAYENLIIAQTLSKSRSLAGLRVGFAIGHEALIDGMNRIKNSFNSYTVDRLAIAGAKAAFLDEDYFQETRSNIIKTRERVINKLNEMNFTVIPSKANFIFIRHKKKPAAELFARLRENGVLVRYFNKPLIDNFLRVSIGTDYEMDIFLHEIGKEL